jgi:hypothetical protein
MYPIDITDLKEEGEALVAAIIDAVKQTQMYLIRPYPDTLTMTAKQFEFLCPDQEDHMAPHEYLYKTPLCVMEVRVKDTHNLVSTVVS